MRKLVLKNAQSPGDIVMLTAAVRDLHRACPGEFLVDVRTSCPDLWLNNPNLTALADDDPGVEVIECRYPLIHQSNRTPGHFLHAFPAFLSERLGVNIRVTDFRGDIHMSDVDKHWSDAAEALDGPIPPFWLIVSGGKFDYTIKWWDPARYQEVVDAFRGRIAFVQVGGDAHHHPALDGVVDLRGKTTLRQLVRLVYGAEGVVTPVQPADAPGRSGRNAAGSPEEPPVCRDRRGARAAPLHRLSASSVHPPRRRAALQRPGRMLAIAHRRARRRRRERQSRSTLRERRAGAAAALHGHDPGARGHRSRRALFRRRPARRPRHRGDGDRRSRGPATRGNPQRF